LQGSGQRPGCVCQQRLHHQDRHPREGGDPVRCGLSIPSPMSLEYWIPAFAGMTTECVFAFSRHVLPEVASSFAP